MEINRLLLQLAQRQLDPGIRIRKVRIGTMPVLVLQPKARRKKPMPGLLWIHGGGYMTGMKEMVYVSRAADLVKKYGITVVSPGYRLSWERPYPAALQDCYRTLLFMKKYASDFQIDPERIMVGGESAGGGLTAAVCMLAKDRGQVKVAWQFPLYPMLSNLDTVSSRNNHGRGWDTRRNHLGWKMYLRENAKRQVASYASPSRRKDFRGLPPCYTFVGDGEPFYAETLEYVRNLQEAGVKADVDVFHTNLHGFDILESRKEPGKTAIRRFDEQFRKVLTQI